MARTTKSQIRKVERQIEKRIKIKKAKAAKEKDKNTLKTLRAKLSKMK